MTHNFRINTSKISTNITTTTSNNNANVDNSDLPENRGNGISQEQKDAELAKAAIEKEYDPLVKTSADFIVNKQFNLDVSIFGKRHSSICKRVYDAAMTRAGTSSPTNEGLKFDIAALNNEKSVIQSAISDFKTLIADEKRAEKEAANKTNIAKNNTQTGYNNQTGLNNWRSMNGSVFQRNQRRPINPDYLG